MKKILGLVVCFFFCCTSLRSQDQKKVEIVKFDWYERQRAVENDTTYIINFWASWCVPCVNELPEIDHISSKYAHEKVKVILVSLDHYKKLAITIIPFLTKTKIQSESVLLNEPDYNSWIEKVDKSWSGSIPATVIFNHHKHLYRFIEGETTFIELDQIIQTIK